MELFDALGFRWDRDSVPAVIPTHSIHRVSFRFHRMLPEFVWDASVLEGNPFTFPEVKTLLDGITVGGRKISDHEQVLNLANSSKRLLSLVKDGKFELSKTTFTELHAIVARVVENSISIRVDGIDFKIISPLDLLKSKVANLGAHLNKRCPEGIAQASMAIGIVNQHLREMIAKNAKPPYSQFEQVIQLAMSDPALYANHSLNIDPIQALPLDALPPDDPFLVKRYPVAMRQIQIKRDKFDDLIERMERYDHAPSSSWFNV